ncbi:MAG: DMT family transporter [Actinobacteria bacterium]|nr:DMT family transporter [Actinomycetota bacterium]
MNSQHHRTDLTALAIAIVAVSSSGPMIAACAAPALAIAFWRCFIGATVTAPFAWLKNQEIWRNLTKRDLVGAALAGFFLGLHFAAWIPSLRYTSIAAATAIVATQVVWAALIAHGLGVKAPGKEWFGIAISLIGVIMLTGIDVSLNPTALIGDLLALLGAMFAAAYMTVGQRVRKNIPTSVYTTLVYAAAAAVLLVFVLVSDSPLTGYAARDWILILGLTAIAQLLGHTLMNMALRSLSATTISLAILLEMPGAVLIAWFWPGQQPPWQIFPAVVLIMTGLVIVISSTRAGYAKTDQAQL